MPDVLIHGATHRSAALRHELPLGIVDPVSYFEVDGRRVLVIIPLEADARGGGRARSGDPRPIRARARRADRRRHALARDGDRAVRARRRASSARAGSWCPPRSPVAVADRLRADGIEVVPDELEFIRRRRSKTQARSTACVARRPPPTPAWLPRPSCCARPPSATASSSATASPDGGGGACAHPRRLRGARRARAGGHHRRGRAPTAPPGTSRAAGRFRRAHRSSSTCGRATSARAATPT